MKAKLWATFLLLTVAMLLAAGCYYQPSGSESAARANLALAKALPANISSIALVVSGPGMQTMASVYPAGTTSAILEVPAGLARTFTLLANTPSVTLKGEATVDLAAGETSEVMLDPVIFDSQIIVPDNLNQRLVQISDMQGTGWLEKKGASAINPYDVDFDSQGRILFTNDSGVGPLQVLDDITSVPQALSVSATALHALAIDREVNLAYFSSWSTLYRKDLGNVADLGSVLSLAVSGNINGLAVGESGVLYVAAYLYGDGGVLLKYDPITQQVLKSFSAPTFPEGSEDPWDVTVLGGHVYATYPRVGRVLELDLDLNYLAEYRGPEGDLFYGPKRFVAILSRRLSFIDEGGFPVDTDRLVSINGIDGAGLQTYGSSGPGQGEFEFYAVC